MSLHGIIISLRLLTFSGIQITFICIFLLYNTTIAQQNELQFKIINTSDGLSNNQITCITQDAYGYMWFGTDEGLNRYDGYSNTIFKKKLWDTTSLIDDHVNELFIDSQKRLWIGTLNGLCLFDADKEIFKRYKVNPYNSSKTANRITAIREDAWHNLFVTSEIGILYMVKNDQLQVVKDFRSTGLISDFIIDKEGTFWIGSFKGIITYNRENDQQFQVTGYGEREIKNAFTYVQTIFEKDDKIWIGTNSGQVAFINKNDYNASVLSFTNMPVNHIHDLFIDSDSTLYIGTNQGMFAVDKHNKTIGHFSNLQNYIYGIGSNSVLCLYKDIQGNLWVGTMNGLSLSVNGKHFQYYNRYSQRFQLDISNIQGMKVDYAGNLWLGSSDRGINVINPSSGLKKLFMPDPSNRFSLGESSVINLFEDKKKNMWIGTYQGYLQRFVPSSGKFISYDFDKITNGNKEVKDIRSMAEDRMGNLWFICHGFGLFKFNPETGAYRIFSKDSADPNHSLADNWAFQVMLEQDSMLWIATPSGLSCLNINTEQFINYTYNENDTLSLSSNQVNSVFRDSYGNLWVGTFDGLNFYNRHNKTFIRFYQHHGLPSNQIRSFVEEKPGKIWMGTGYGLSCMEYTLDEKKGIQGVQFRNYDESDNLQNYFFWSNSSAKLKSGELVFGTEHGIVLFDPSEIVDNKVPPPVFITEIMLFNKKVGIGEADSILKHNIIHTEVIKLSHNQNYITFKYIAFNYISSSKNQYAYKLEGFDSDWNNIGNKREVTYTNLTPGKYTFYVKASNNDGVWNNSGDSIQVIILSPWWKTWWFQTLMGILLISLAWLFYYLRIAFYKKQQQRLLVLVNERTQQLEANALSLKDKQEEIESQKEELIQQKEELEATNDELYKHRNMLEQLVEERTSELIKAKNRAEESDKLKSSFLANLSHEIRTPLNAILGFSSLLGDAENTEEERKEYTSIMESSSIMLLDLINNILDISKIEAGQMELILTPVNLKTVLNHLADIFHMLIKQHQTSSDKLIEFKVNIQDEVLKTPIMVDKLRLEQVLSNLINNAVKFTTKGTIEIGCEKNKEGNLLEFYVKDTGIGIKPENLEVIFERFRKLEDDRSQIHRGTGLGLAISKQLVQLMGGRMYATSDYGKGSIFHFTIPLLKTNVKTEIEKMNTALSDSPDLSSYSILVAEDDISNFLYIEKLIQKTGAHIFHAENGKQAVDMVSKINDLSLILMDIKMPEMDGVEALHEIRKINNNIPIVAQTAYALANEVIELRKEGFDDYIAKPINPRDFYRIITFFIKNIR